MKNDRPEGASSPGRTLTPRQWTLIALLLPPAIALIIRIAAFKELMASPLRYYSAVGGLDMKGLLELGRWLYEGRGLFSIYSGLAALAMWLNGGREWPEALIFFQYFCGTVLAFLVAWTALRFTGRRGVALTAGLAAALYAPELMYESVTLRESIMVFVCTLSLALVITLRRRHFDGWRMVLAGAILALPCLVRVSAGIWTATGMLWVWWYICRRQRYDCKKDWLKIIYKGALIGLGAFIILLPSWSWNYFSQGYPLPFYLNIGYSVKVGKVDNAKTMNVDMKTEVPRTENKSCPMPSGKASVKSDCKVVCPFVKYGKKVVEVFLPFEKANNLNFYFLRAKFKILNYLLRPEILLSLAVVMLIWWLVDGSVFKKESLLFIYLVAMTISMCVFLPLARYRLVLLPVLCIAGGMLMTGKLYSMLRQKSLWKFVIIMSVLVTYCLLTWPCAVPLRSEDFVAWGIAKKSRGDMPLSYLNDFENAYKLKPDSVSAAFNFAGALLHTGKYQTAAVVCLKTLQSHPDNQGLKLNASSALMACRNPKAAERILRTIREPSDPLGYYYNLGECLRLQNRLEEALKAYKSALELAVTDSQKSLLKKKITRLTLNLKRK